VKPPLPTHCVLVVQPLEQKPVLVLHCRPASPHWLVLVHCTQVFVVVSQV
jgi:hypothetical protein